jgi:hypothetical protein|nr:MAG TPA: hypothetical protein [Caudoviricetes sp.]
MFYRKKQCFGYIAGEEVQICGFSFDGRHVRERQLTAPDFFERPVTVISDF